VVTRKVHVVKEEREEQRGKEKRNEGWRESEERAVLHVIKLIGYMYLYSKM